MLIAGEASGDRLGAELVQALRDALADLEAHPSSDLQPLHASLDPVFFGAGGPRMAAAGVDLAFDMTRHSVIGLSDALKKYFEFRVLFGRLRELAIERQPDAIICIDFSGFNRRFAHAISMQVKAGRDWFHNWDPRIIQYVSPQVWASREDRIYQVARDYHLLLSTFPFEKSWYEKRVPQFPVEYVGNPVVERCAAIARAARRFSSSDKSQESRGTFAGTTSATPLVVLLPGSRRAELSRHLPVLAATASEVARQRAVRFVTVVPEPSLVEQTKTSLQGVPGLEIQVGQLEEVLARADLAITKSGTVTLECAVLGVPAIVFYRTSAITYAVGKRIVKVKYLAMPNLLADEPLYPEFVQDAATPANLARAALDLLTDSSRRDHVKARLAEITASFGPPGASQRAADASLRLLYARQPASFVR